MIEQIYDFTLKLYCDGGCGKKKVWKNKGVYPYNNMTGNKMVARKEGWYIKGCTNYCPKCKKLKKQKLGIEVLK